MSTPLLSDLREPPVVGQRYLVPCVRYRWFSVEAWWPVIGPRHTHRRFFDFPQSHYHVDARFIAPSMVKRVASWAEDIASIAGRSPLYQRGMNVAPAKTTLRPRICHRQGTRYAYGGQAPVRQLREHLGDPAPAIRLPDGRTLCPHRKADLTQFPRDSDGIVTCPLHGLRVACSKVAP